MKFHSILFSPTGGTQRAAELLARELSESAETIDLTDPALDFSTVVLNAEDTVLIAVPSYGGRVPAIAAQRLSVLHGNGARTILMCVYGNRAYEDTLVELEDLAKASGFSVIAGISAVAEHSIIRQYATGRPDLADGEQLRMFAGKIREKLSRADCSSPVLPGNRPYKKMGGGGLVPTANKSCNHCGLCAEKCPVKAIDPTTLAADKNRCISCMRCVTVCPHTARTVNAAMVSVAALAIKKACIVRKENELFL